MAQTLGSQLPNSLTDCDNNEKYLNIQNKFAVHQLLSLECTNWKTMCTGLQVVFYLVFPHRLTKYRNVTGLKLHPAPLP